MKVEDIIKLLDAGYTREEIQALEKPEPKVDPEPEADPEPKAYPEPDVDPEHKAYEKSLLDKLEELNRSILTMNIQRSSQPEAESVDDILAAVIRPPKKKEE